MNQDAYSDADDVLVDPIILTINNTSAENDAIQDIDLLVQPLIDTNEFVIHEHDETKLNTLEEKVSSILSLHSLRLNETDSNLKKFHRCAGIFYALLGSSLFTSSGFIIKQLRVDFFDALLCRFIIQTSILSVFIVYKRYKILNGPITLIGLQIIRTILASSGLFLFYLSYRYIPLPDLTTFRYTQVIWTSILAVIILREQISKSTVIAIVLTLVGVVCVAQPVFLFGDSKTSSNINGTLNHDLNYIDLESNKTYRFLGLSLALSCALAISASIVLNKKLLVLKYPQSILMFQFSALNLFILLINQIRNRFILRLYLNHSMFTWQYFLAALVSLAQLLSSTFTQKAIKLEHPSIVSVTQSSDILFSIVLQNLIANVKSNWLALLGSALVTASIFIIGIHKFANDRKKLPDEVNSSKV